MSIRHLSRAAVAASVMAVGLALLATAAPASATTSASSNPREGRIVGTNAGILQWELEDEEPW